MRGWFKGRSGVSSLFGGKQGAAVVINQNDGTSSNGHPPSPPPRKWWQIVIEFLSTIIFFLIVVTASVVIIAGSAYLFYQMGVRHGERGPIYGPGVPNAPLIRVNEPVVNDWIPHVGLPQVISRKVHALQVAVDGSHNILLGKYEVEKLKRRGEAALHYYLAAADGHPDARDLLSRLGLKPEDYRQVLDDFILLHQLNGADGHLRLGQHHLGADAFKIAKKMSTRLRFYPPNDYVRPATHTEAYINFQIAVLCDSPQAYEWRAEVAKFYRIAEAERNTLNTQASQRLQSLQKQFKGDRDDYCRARHLSNAIDRLLKRKREAESAERFDFEDEACALPEDDSVLDIACEVSGGSGSSYRVVVPTFRELIDEVYGRKHEGGDASRRGRGSGDASQYYRNSPGADSNRNIQTPGADGLPDVCVVLDAGGECLQRESALTCSDRSKYYFNRGEADMSVGRARQARDHFSRAIEIGRACSSEWSVQAANRLAALNLTCEYTVDSLARISRGYENNPDGGAIIDLASRQRALAALGHYQGNIDGRPGPATREAVRKFQRGFGFSETGDVTPIETVYLICSAAQNANDLKSINTLGIMYMAGLGVVQNTDIGLRWLKLAAERGNSDSLFNLSLIYGTGTVLSSFKLCGLVETIDIADSYLEEAARLGHEPARKLIDLYGSLAPSERWEKIKAELQLNDFYTSRLEQVGEGCRPNP